VAGACRPHLFNSMREGYPLATLGVGSAPPVALGPDKQKAPPRDGLKVEGPNMDSLVQSTNRKDRHGRQA